MAAAQPRVRATVVLEHACAVWVSAAAFGNSHGCPDCQLCTASFRLVALALCHRLASLRSGQYPIRYSIRPSLTRPPPAAQCAFRDLPSWHHLTSELRLNTTQLPASIKGLITSLLFLMTFTCRPLLCFLSTLFFVL